MADASSLFTGGTMVDCVARRDDRRSITGVCRRSSCRSGRRGARFGFRRGTFNESGGSVLRSGRNECGSGKKFKKCCLGDDGPKLTGKTLPVKTQ